MHEPIVFFTASRAYGIYESEYQVIASDWIIMNRNASPDFFNWKYIIKLLLFNFSQIADKNDQIITTTAETIVIIIDTMTTTVAISLVSANIFFNCLNGPIKKHVLLFEK